RILIVAILAVLATMHNLPAAQRQPIVINPGEPQLFVDDLLIESSAGLQRTLRQPAKDNDGNVPVIAITDEFGDMPATHQANGTIVFDPKVRKWVMIAIGAALQLQGPERVRLYRYTSDDAMNWTRGDDGTPQHITVDLYDPASRTSASNTDLFSFCYDHNDPQDPYKGWLWFANWGDGREGIYYVCSRDGRSWQRGGQIMSYNSRSIEQDGWKLRGPSDVTTFYADPISGKYLALIKFTNIEPVGQGNRQRSRACAFVDRLDEPLDMNRIERVALVPPAAEKNGDMPHDEYYASTAWRYGSLWLGGLKVWHGKGDHSYSAAGSAYLKLVVSRDGLNWRKVQFKNDQGIPEVWIPNGPEGGNGGRNDGGYITEFSQGPLRIGHELIYYYGASSWGKNHPPGKRVTGGGIFRARLRPDGFVSVDAGTLTTRPLVCSGSDLSVNAIGPVQVELLDVNAQPLAATTLSGDSLAHQVRFGNRTLRDVAGDGPFRLRLAVGSGGRVYSFTIH
ncbi:MAG TPA: hypothetical protein VNL70_07000, partial [Tepidisphaeraceae bacterium]|nr:hypothetical protein [Tepidisphaeraceae bacterium]